MLYTSPDFVKIPQGDMWGEMFERRNPGFPETHRILFDDQNRSYSFRYLKTVSRKCGVGMQAILNIQKGEIIAIIANNIAEALFIMWAGWYAGACVAFVSPGLPADELEHQLRDCGATTVFFQGALAPKLLPITEAVGYADDRLIALDNQARDGIRNWTALRTAGEVPAAERPPRPVIDAEKDVALLTYTSATNVTIPLGVLNSHRNLLANTRQIYELDRGHIDWRKDKMLLHIPLVMTYSIVLMLYYPIFYGIPVYMMETFDMVKVLRYIHYYKITYIFLAPPIAEAIAYLPMVSNFDMTSVSIMTSACAEVHPQLAPTLYKKYGIRMRQGYGMPELSPAVAIQNITAFNTENNLGPLFANTTAKVLDIRDGRALGPNQPGELVLKGPHVMLGYTQPVEREIFTEDGFYRSGDLCYMTDDDKVVYVTSIHEVNFMPDGTLISGDMVEHDIMALGIPGLKEVVVKKVNDGWRGYLHVTEEERMDVAGREDELVELLNENLERGRRITEGLMLIDQVPRSYGGKIMRRLPPELDGRDPGARFPWPGTER